MASAPRLVACVGGNYAAHLAEMWAGRSRRHRGSGAGGEEGQWGFSEKSPRSRRPSRFLIRSGTRRFEYEGEVAVVIGKCGKDIPRDRINEYLGRYVVPRLEYP